MAKIDAVVRRCLYTAYALVCSGLFWTSLNAQICPGMACNNQLQISVQQDCNIAFNADLLLEGAEALQGSQFYLTLNELGVNSVPIPMTGSGTFVVPSPFPFGTFSYLLENDCGNSCWGNIIVEDNLPPIADSCPCAVGSGDCELSCLEEPWIVNSSSFTEDLGWNPTFTDNCGDLGSILFNDIIVDGASCGSRSLTRTWTSTYTSHGVTITEILCVQEFTLDPIEINDIICPINLTALNPLGDFSLDCQIDSHPDSIAAFFDDPDTPVNEGMPYAYPHIMDGSKFSAIKALSCNIGVSFEDQILPLCGSGSFASKRILRTWTILDWCTSEASFCIQTLEFTDKEGPTVYELPTSINASTQPWLCAANINLPIPQFDDVCGIVTSVGYVLKENNIEVSSGSGFSISSLAVGNYDLYYVATDDCGNTSEFGPIPVTVLDDAPPVAVSDDQIVISLTGSATDGNGVAKLFANSVDNGSYDICGPIHFEIRRDEDLDCQFAGNTTYTTELVPVLDEDGNEVLDADGEVVMENVDTDNGAFVKFCCSDLTDQTSGGVEFGLHKVWLRVWDDADGDGVFGSAGDNHNLSWTLVRVENKLAPLIICPTSPVSVSCLGNANDLTITGEAQASSTCGIEPVGFSDESSMNGCGIGTILRTWFIDRDSDGIADPDAPKCTQTINITQEDIFDGDDIEFPTDTTISCTLFNADERPIWDDSNTCSLLGYSLKTDTFLFEEGACEKIINTWTVIDWCQYDPLVQDDGIWTGVQIIKVIDTAIPEIECQEKILVNAYEGCVTEEITISNTASDTGDCPSPWLSWTVELDVNFDWVVDYTYSSNGSLPITASGEELSFVLVDRNGNPLNLNIGTHRIEWAVTDGCGNRKQCRSELVVVDTKAPTPYCVQSLSTTVMEQAGYVEIWAVDYELGSTDNCTDQDDLVYSFSGETIQPSVRITCAGGGGDYELDNGSNDIFQLEMWVWDLGSDQNCDGTITNDERNRDYCFVTLRVDDQVGACEDVGGGALANISGAIITEYGDEVNEAEVMLNSNHPEYPTISMTGDDGRYAFMNHPMYNDYNVSVERDDEYLNGVSTLDLVMIQRHILGIESLDSPYKLLAADVNSTESISASDLVELRKLILGIDTELSNNSSWRFVDALQTFSDPTQPWPFNESLDLDNISNHMLAEDFIGVKIGDVNGNAVINNIINTEVRSQVNLNVENQDAKAGQSVVVNFNVKDLNNLHGLQFTLNHSDLIFKDVIAGAINVTEQNVAPNDNYLVFSWNAQNAKEASADLFSLVFEAKRDLVLSEVLSMNNRVASPEIYMGTSVTSYDLNITFDQSQSNEVTSSDIVLLQNEPNPFANKTKVAFILPAKMDAQLKVYDVTGKLVYQVSDVYSKGLNEITLSKEMLAVDGLLYYQLETDQKILTKKMLLIK